MLIRRYVCILGGASLLAMSCAGLGLSAESTCEEFMAASREAQADIVEQLYRERHPERPANSMALGNALRNIEYTCQQSPSRQIGDIDF
jgi:hypothetical protein